MLSPRRYPTSLPDQREGRAQADSGLREPQRRLCLITILEKHAYKTKSRDTTSAEGAVGSMRC